MTAVRVLWEDEHCEALHRVLRRLLEKSSLDTSRTVLRSSARGNGGFVPFVESWTTAGDPSREEAGFLVCVADADCADTEQCCPEADTPPEGDSTKWVEHASGLWTDKLRAAAAGDPERVHGRFLRWSKESLLIACYDFEEALSHAGEFSVGSLREILGACDPADPNDVEDARFMEVFRKPNSCMKIGVHTAGLSKYHKGGQQWDDVLDAVSEADLDKLEARVPDLRTLVDLIIRLCSP